MLILAFNQVLHHLEIFLILTNYFFYIHLFHKFKLFILYIINCKYLAKPKPLLYIDEIHHLFLQIFFLTNKKSFHFLIFSREKFLIIILILTRYLFLSLDKNIYQHLTTSNNQYSILIQKNNSFKSQNLFFCNFYQILQFMSNFPLFLYFCILVY